ncbi:tRNA methyltransferase 10 [Homalodisca vitripennis]|nr:tRNA methyltransferase 10 [Homalodisca vitripennis]KAG8289700.1 tRNA methyltransferase 10 [Homalodisca vitripennis]
MSTNVEINDSEVFNLEYLFGDSGQNVFICEGQENKWVDRDKYPEDSTVGKESERINLETCTSKEENESKEKIRQKIMVPIEVPQYLSKSQRKKYGKKVLWETKLKPLMREKEKVKVKQKKLEACLNNTIRSPSRKLLKRATMVSSKCTLRVAIDFSFDDLMSEKDIRKCVKQLSHCYCLNRRTANPVQLYATNFCGRSKEVMAYNIGYQNWDIHFNEENHTSVFLKNDIVYLTSDSENVLSELDDRKVYVIGALVDYNRHKGHTLRVAIEQGVSHAQLPIAQFIAMRSRQVIFGGYNPAITDDISSPPFACDCCIT